MLKKSKRFRVRPRAIGSRVLDRDPDESLNVAIAEGTAGFLRSLGLEVPQRGGSARLEAARRALASVAVLLAHFGDQLDGLSPGERATAEDELTAMFGPPPGDASEIAG